MEDEIAFRLGLKTSEFERALKSSVNTVDSTLMSLTKKMTLGLGAGFGLGAVKDFLSGAVDKIHSLSKASKDLDVSTSTIQAFQRMTRGAWDSEEALEKLSKMIEKIGALRFEGKDTFAGIKLNDGKYLKDNNTIIKEFIETAAKIPDATKRIGMLAEAGRHFEDISGALEPGKLDKILQDYTLIGDKQISTVERGVKIVKGAYGFAGDMVMAGLAKIVESPQAIASSIPGMDALRLKNAYEKQDEVQPVAAQKHKADTMSIADKQRIRALDEAITKSEFELLKPVQKIADLEEQKKEQLSIYNFEQNTAEKRATAFQNIRQITAEIEKTKLELDIKQEAVSARIHEHAQKVKDLELERVDAAKALNVATRELNEKQTDRYKATVHDWAQGGFNRNRWHNYQIRAARAVEWAEARGNYVAQGYGNYQLADKYYNYADRMRGTMTGLTSNEQRPFESLTETMEKSKEHLRRIDEKLTQAKYQ